VHARRFVRAVLRPHDGEHRQFQVGGRATEQAFDVGRLVVGQPEGGVQRFGHLRSTYKRTQSTGWRCLDTGMDLGSMAPMASRSRRKSQMTDAHKAALAQGRNEGRTVRRYLDALDANRPKRGRKRTPESVQKRLRAIDHELASADRLNEL